MIEAIEHAGQDLANEINEKRFWATVPRPELVKSFLSIHFFIY